MGVCQNNQFLRRWDSDKDTPRIFVAQSLLYIRCVSRNNEFGGPLSLLFLYISPSLKLYTDALELYSSLIFYLKLYLKDEVNVSKQ